MCEIQTGSGAVTKLGKGRGDGLWSNTVPPYPLLNAEIFKSPAPSSKPPASRARPKIPPPKNSPGNSGHFRVWQ